QHDEMVEHLEGCDDCRALADELHGAEEAIDGWLDGFAGAGHFEAAWSRALAEEGASVPRRRPPITRYLVAAAAVLAVGSAFAAAWETGVLHALLPAPEREIVHVAPVPAPEKVSEPTVAEVPSPEPDVPIEAPAVVAPQPEGGPPRPDAGSDGPPSIEQVSPERPEAPPLDSRVVGGPSGVPAPPEEVTTIQIIRSGLPEADCDDLIRLEPSAMLGRLTDDQIACLEENLAYSARKTTRDRISRLLMANAWAKGDKPGWEKLLQRHLEEIDRTDPDLCYKYALFLSKRGPGQALGVIAWAEVALENRSDWRGETYRSRVYNLYKLRAAAAQDLWGKAEMRYAVAPTEEADERREEARTRTFTMAREWYRFAALAGRDARIALQLCGSAGGDEGACLEDD
ncbi:MAG: hypothetical protein JRI25_27805, partial [Deltaproteobacteria bacterium]|nr:hypothetical protein [Deltaproteobacteria bacterium]